MRYSSAFFAAALLISASPSQALQPFFGGDRKLARDLVAIAPGSTPSDAQVQAIDADLADFEQSLIVPSATDVQQLASDLAAAVAGGALRHRGADVLAADLALLIQSTHAFAFASPDGSNDFVDGVQKILTHAGVSSALIAPVVADLNVIEAAYAVSTVATTQTYTLEEENIPEGLLMNYSGHAVLVTAQAGADPQKVMLTVTAEGLAPGTFVVAVTKTSDGSVVTLGNLKVGPGFGPISPTTNSFLSSPKAASPLAEILSFGVAVFGTSTGQPFPANFDPTDIAKLTVTDSSNIERLTAAFGAASADSDGSNRAVNLHVIAGATDTAAKGTIAYDSHILAGGRESDDFQLSLSGLPVSAQVTLLTNGASAGTYETSAKGTLRIHSGLYPTSTVATPPSIPVGLPSFYTLPTSVDVLTLTSVSVTDASGNVLAGGSLQD